MLSKKNRLANRKDFAAVFRNGEKFGWNGLFSLAKKNTLKDSRFGFVVSSKISSKAVTRNKIKRRMRNIVEHKLAKIKSGFDFIFIAQKGLENSTFEEMAECFDKIFKKLKLEKDA